MPVTMIGPKFYAFDPDTGLPLAGGKVYTKASGTDTDKATFTTEVGDVENTNPVILNAAGYASIKLDGSYKIVVTDADDVEIWSEDPVSDASQLGLEWIDQRDASQTSAITFTTPGNQTASYLAERRIKMEDASTLYGVIDSSSYGGGLTTVTVRVDGDAALTAALSEAYVGLVSGAGRSIGDIIYHVDTIAKLKARSVANVANNQIINVLSYYTPNLAFANPFDGGGGEFAWDATSTEADNSGTIIQVTGVTTGRWIRDYSGKVNIRWFGAHPDKSEAVNDTAIQSALDLRSSGTVFGPVGGYPTSATFLIPNRVSLIGEQAGAGSSYGFTILYSGAGECLRSVGIQDVVPSVGTLIGNLQIRKTTQASTLAAIALISGARCHVYDVRTDSDNAAYNFKYGVVLDQSEVSSVSRVDIQAPSDTGIWLVNGDDYTPGNAANFTNVVTLRDINVNSPGNYGIAHDGGGTFVLEGSNNLNACPVPVYIAGLSAFSLKGILCEASTGQADIYISQYKKDLTTSVGACSSGDIADNRLSGATTNCIYVRGPGSQSTGISIRGNRFGPARSGSAIGLSDADALQSSEIGPNDNLGGSGKDYMDSGVYVHNTVTAIPNGAQQEQKRMVFMPGIVSTARSGIEKAVTFTNSATYTVDDEDECIHCVTTSNDVTIELPVATKGRTITGLKKAGANNVIFDAGAGKLVYRSGTGSQTRTITTIGEAWTVQAEDDGGNWYVIGSSN